MTRHVVCLTLGLIFGVTQTLQADDWPQWRGPQRDGVWREEGIVDAFPEDGLKVLWRVPVAGGYAGPAVANGKVFVADYLRKTGDSSNAPQKRNVIEGTERVQCFDVTNGELIWKHEYPRAYRISYPAGPRVTPTVHQGKVYSLGAEGDLFCLDEQTGSVLWHKEFKRDYKVETPLWGFSGHPLVDGEKLICLVGGEGSVAVAFNKDNGEEIWRALSASEPGYAPPTMIRYNGDKQLIIWSADAVNGLNPESGKVYWSVPLKPSYGMSIMAPQQSGDYLFASGIGNVGALLKLSPGPNAEVAWKGTIKSAVYCANSTPFIEDGTIYGVDCRQGQLRGVDLMTGDRLWETFKPTTGSRRQGHGTAFIVKHKDRFFLFSETGDLILSKLSRDGYEEISRFHVLEPTGEAFGRDVVWSHPAFANKCVYARNDKELVCVSLAK